jgi:hypothetical protein
MGADTYTWELWLNGHVLGRVCVRDVQGPYEGNPDLAPLFQEAAQHKGSYVLLSRNSRGVELMASFYCGYSDSFYEMGPSVDDDLEAMLNEHQVEER